jgi:L-fucose mutarotase
MLKYRLLHPELSQALARSGHGSRILIADSNYPHYTGAPATAARIYLNLAPGLISATEVLKVVLDAIPVEAAHVMSMDNNQEAPVVEEFRKLLPRAVSVHSLPRFDFYDAVNVPQTSVVIATGEQRLYANLLLTVGVMTADGVAKF